jgi:hypothetical protein
MEELNLQSSENVKCVIAILAIEMLNLFSSNWKYVTSGYVADLRLCFDVALNLRLISTGHTLQIVILNS